MTKQVVTMIGLLVLSATVFAVPPHQPKVLAPPTPTHPNGAPEMWKMEAFADDDPNHPGGFVLEICFYYKPPVGTHDAYLWQAVMPGMTLGGEARQEGDQIFMVGGGGNPPVPPTVFTSMQWEIVSKDLGAGHGQYWTFNQLFLFSNAIFTKDPTGKCP